MRRWWLRARPAAVAAGAAMVAAGAAWLDVGGESTRPGALPVDAAEEQRRVLPVIHGVIERIPDVCVSIDTTKASVAAAALAVGARMVNDISAGADAAMFPLLAEHRCPVVLMHMQGTPQTMQLAPRYDDVVDEVIAYLSQRMKVAVESGVREDTILIDPGIGFGKTVDHNMRILSQLPRFIAALGRPLVVGLSRKSFLAAFLGALPGREAIAWSVSARDQASHIIHGLIARHCALLRVHDVVGAVMACRLSAGLAAASGAPHPEYSSIPHIRQSSDHA